MGVKWRVGVALSAASICIGVATSYGISKYERGRYDEKGVSLQKSLDSYFKRDEKRQDKLEQHNDKMTTAISKLQIDVSKVYQEQYNLSNAVNKNTESIKDSNTTSKKERDALQSNLNQIALSVNTLQAQQKHIEKAVTGTTASVDALRTELLPIAVAEMQLQRGQNNG